MSQAGNDRTAQPFTLRQRRGLLVLCATMLIAVVVGLAMNRSYIDDPIPAEGARHLELQDRIDPNEADAPLLAALPALGERRALDIVEFRERALQREPGRVVYQRIEDLMQIRGIGTAIIEQLRPFLRFPQAGATNTSQAAEPGAVR